MFFYLFSAEPQNKGSTNFFFASTFFAKIFFFRNRRIRGLQFSFLHLHFFAKFFFKHIPLSIDCLAQIAVHRLPYMDCTTQIARHRLHYLGCTAQIALYRLQHFDCTTQKLFKHCLGSTLRYHLHNYFNLLIDLYIQMP